MSPSAQDEWLTPAQLAAMLDVYPRDQAWAEAGSIVARDTERGRVYSLYSVLRVLITAVGREAAEEAIERLWASVSMHRPSSV